MRWLALVLLAACTTSPGKDPDLVPDEQSVCSNLPAAACRADARCQLAYVDSAFSPGPSVLHCLVLESFVTTGTACETMDRDGCRSRRECAPVFHQELGPDDGAVGDPTYDHCALESELAAP